MMKSDDDRDKDRDDDGRGADMPEGLGHEKLRVYRRGLDYVTWSHPVLAGIEQSAVVPDHWTRAAESILENIANGNSRQIAQGKWILARVVPLVLGLRGYLDDSHSKE